MVASSPTVEAGATAVATAAVTVVITRVVTVISSLVVAAVAVVVDVEETREAILTLPFPPNGE